MVSFAGSTYVTLYIAFMCYSDYSGGESEEEYTDDSDSGTDTNVLIRWADI